MPRSDCYPACVYLQLQGSLMVGSLFQMFVGFSGLIGLFMCFIGPLTIAPTICLIGLSLFDSAGNSAGYHWGVAVMWVLLSESVFQGVGIIMQQYNNNNKCKKLVKYDFKMILFLSCSPVRWKQTWILLKGV